MPPKRKRSSVGSNDGGRKKVNSSKPRSRKKKNTSASPPPSSSSSSSKDNSSSSLCLVSSIIAKLASIQESRSRCLAAIQAIPTASLQRPSIATDTNTNTDTAVGGNNYIGSSKSSSDDDANIILLATILLHKFIKYSNQSKNDTDTDTNVANDTGAANDVTHNVATDVAIVQARMAYLIAHILMTDKSILERTINNNSHSHIHIHDNDNNTNNTTNSKQRDAKTLLSKTILATLATTLHSYQHFTSISLNAASASANNHAKTKAINIKSSIQQNLSSLETLLLVAKRKVTPASSSVLHIPVTSQHAHSIPMNSQGEYAWNSLLNLLDGGDATSGDDDGDGNGIDAHIITECRAASTWLESLKGPNLNRNVTGGGTKKGKKMEQEQDDEKEGEIEWMKPFVGLEGVGGDEEGRDIPPVKRKRRNKSGTPPKPVVASAAASVSNTTTTTNDVAEEVLKQELLNGNVIEGRITVKKFASMAFAHCCAGQYHLLKGLISLLEDAEEHNDGGEKVAAASSENDGEKGDVEMERICWKDIMGVPDVLEWSNVPSSILPSTKRNKKTCIEIRAMPSLVLSALAVRIVEIIQESGKLCGTVLIKNGMEDYIQDLYDAFDGVVLPEKKGGDSTSFYSGVVLGDHTKRPSLYNLVICVLRLMILNHGQCLKDIALLAEERSQKGTGLEDFPFDLVVGQDTCSGVVTSFENGPVVGHVLVNEEELVKEAIIKEYSHYNPVMHKTIETLIRCGIASYSSSGKNDSKILYAFAAAFALKASVVEHNFEPRARKKKGANLESVVVVDAKLCSFAVHHLTEILVNIVAFTKNSFRGDEVDKGASMNADMIGHFYLDNPIVLDQTLSQAGLFTVKSRNDSQRVETADEKGWRNGFLLSLFFRALLPTNKKATKATLVKTPFAVVDGMMNAVKACYSIQQDTVAMAVGKVKKRTRFTRCALAADCLDAVRKCIEQIPYSVATPTGLAIMTVRIRATVRKLIPASIVDYFIGLGQMLEFSLVGQRLLWDSTSSQNSSSSVSDRVGGKLEFESWERRLWASHIKSCLAFVRGRPSYASRMSSTSAALKKSSLGTPSERLSLFQNIAKATTGSVTKWPLYLSPLHHAIVTGNLTSDPLPRAVKDASPEKFICEGFIESILDAFSDPETNIVKKYKVERNRKIQISDEEVPLSIRDARLFAVALSRTPKKERRVLVSKLVNMLHDSLESLSSDEVLKAVLMSSPLYTSFVARILTICSTMIDMVSSGKLLVEHLCEYIGQLHYHLPSFIETDENIDTPTQECVNDWYSRESCFMGLWPDWESAALPHMELPPRNDFEPLSSDDIIKYRALLANAMELGFQSAKNDKCHLVFASWNASAKVCGVDSEGWTGPTSFDTMVDLGNAMKLNHIRDDICELYDGLAKDESSKPNSYLSCLLRRKRSKNPESFHPNRSVDHLKNAASESVKMLKGITKATIEIERNVTPGDCVVAEATLSYISFLASMFTTTETELLTALVKCDKSRRKRKSSSFSADSMGEGDDGECSDESGESDGYHDFEVEEDEEEAQMDGIAKLHHVCNVLGASPFHPDWLDETCHLRSGISEAASVEFAEEMLRALTGFGTAVFTQYSRTLAKVLSHCPGNDQESTIGGSSALAVIRGIRHVSAETASAATLDWQNDIATAFGIDPDLVKFIFNGIKCKNAEAVKESYALNSAQRIKGKLQDFVASGSGWLPNAPEYRAGEEWELLLSDALISPCSKMDLQTDNPTLLSLGSDLLRWKRILQNTVNALVPVNALLRFGLNGAKGRNQHRATNVESGEFVSGSMPHVTYQTSPIRAHVRTRTASAANIAPSQLKTTVNKALCVLAEIQSCGFSSQIIQQSARTATCHLVTVDDDVLNLEGVHAIRNSLVAMKEFASAPKLQSKRRALHLLGKIFGSMGPSDPTSSEFESKVLFCLGSPNDLKISTIAEFSIDLRTTLRKYGEKDIYSDITAWDWNASPTSEIQFLCEAVQGRHKNITSPSVRSSLISCVKDALDTEDRNIADLDFIPSVTVKHAILKNWCKLGTQQIQVVVKNDICAIGNNAIAALSGKNLIIFDISQQLCSLLASLLGAMSGTDFSSEKMFNSILKTLKNTMQHWVAKKELGSVMCFMCVLALRFGGVKDVSKELLKIVKRKKSKEGDQDLFVLELFYRFLQESRKALSGGVDLGQENAEALVLSEAPTFKIAGADKQERQSCSFVSTHGEFTEQHWYNCYTCGLTWDKGCCSLCARICHKGHDVGYSRKSSFFCDCGAEVRTTAGRISCKCLSPQPVLSSINESKLSTTSAQCKHTRQENAPESLRDKSWREAINLVRKYFASIAKKSLDDFVASVDSALIGDLLETFNVQFDLWANQESMPGLLSNDTCCVDGDSNSSENNVSILSRDGTPLELTKFSGTCFSPIRMSKINAIDTKVVTELSVDKAKKVLLTKNAVDRRSIAIDSRGRMVIGEAKALSFCGALSLVNTRHVPNPLETALLRPQLCILGTHKLDFGVVGLSLCQGRDRHLVVWGFTQAKFLCLNNASDKVDLCVDLAMDLEIDDADCESDYVIKVEWITETTVAVFCATCIKLYDIESNTVDNSGKFSCLPSVNFLMAYDDVLIKSGVVVPTTAKSRDIEDDDSVEPASAMRRLIVLFDTGRLHTIDIALDNNGAFDCEGDVSLEYGEGTSFPITGVRRYTGTIPEIVGTTSKSLGEGSTLVFLRQSRILLYKCVSSAMVAFTLDDSGAISGNFEFLPHIIKPENIDDIDNESISGPYSNWTELGCVEKADSIYYRAAFVGKSTRNNKPVMMYIEYNHDRSRLRKIKMPGNIGLTLSMMSSFDGMAAFSGPMVIGNKRDDGMLGPHGTFKERIYLASVISNGILTFHGEDMNADSKNVTSTTSIMSNRRRALSDSGLHRQDISSDRVKFKDAPNPFPSFPLTVFETLQNVTSADELVVIVDGVEDTSANLKRKLLTGSSDYIISKSKDGCTFIMSLQTGTKSKTNNDSAKVKLDDPSKHAIVAVRILLGTNNSDFTPRDIYVMGRAIKPARQKKRWYDVPLSDEEIMLGVRSGFVPIVISGGAEGDRSQAIVDSVEVYAEERTKLSHLFPIKTHGGIDVGNHSPVVRLGAEGRRESLDTSIVVISHVFQLLRGTPGLTSGITEDSLQKLIQVTALDPEKEGSVRNHVVELLKELEPDTHTMQVLLDKGTLQGICNVLKYLDTVVVEFQETSTDNDNADTSEQESAVITGRSGSKILARVNDCLMAAGSIAKERPSNYKNAIESLIVGKTANSSIALHAKALLEACSQCPGVVNATSKLVEMTLHEILAASVDHGAQNNGSLANLETLSEILRSSSQDIVKSCCNTVAKVVKSLKDMSTQVLLHQCDCCGILPITKTRFTMDEEGYDTDLCQGCYQKGISYAVQKQYNPKISVLVDKGPIYITQHDKNLSCHEICQMSSKPVPESSIDQLPNFQSQGRHKSTKGDMEVDDDDEDEQLQIALKMSLEESQEDITDDPLAPTTLTSMIFKKLLDDTVNDLSALDNPRKSNSLHVMSLLLTLVVQCNKNEERIELARTMCKILCREICTLSDICTIYSDEESPISVVKRGRHAIVLYLCALTSLITKQGSISANSTTPTFAIAAPKVVLQVSPSKSKTDPRFICEAHGVPAVRRRCSHGEHKDRRFYVCGMSRKNRCKYFKWADEVDDTAAPKGNAAPEQSNYSPLTKPVVDIHLRSILWNLLNEGNPPLHKKLCTLLRRFIKNSKAAVSTQLEISSNSPASNKSNIVLQHLHSTGNTNYNDDGVFLSVEKLGFSGFPNGSQSSSKVSQSVSLGSSEYLIAEASLDFLALVGAHTSDITQKTYASWEAWYSPLCHIISKNFSPDLRSRAKEMLKCITGGRRATYRQVRDRFVFASQFMELLSHCESPLQASLFVREKARQCGPQWRLSNVTWETLSSGGLLGAQALISEDYYAVTVMEQVTKMLDTLTSTIGKSRSDNWRHFCSLEKLPQQDTDLGGNIAPSTSLMKDGLHNRSPVCLLLWMACSVPESSQVKLLNLINVALTDGISGKTNAKSKRLSVASSNFEDSHGIMSTDGGTDIEFSALAVQRVNEETPEKVLLSGASGLSLNDICAFVTSFVLNGGSAELRVNAKNIAAILASQFPSDNLYSFFQRMATVCLREVGSLGNHSIEFLQMLIDLVSNDGLMCGMDNKHLAQVSIACFTSQTSTNTNVMNTHWNKDVYSVSSETFDVTKCTHCQCCYKGDIQENPKKVLASTSKIAASSSPGAKKQGQPKEKKTEWALEQLTDYRKMRLDQHHTVSAEFSQYVQLKTRLAIHELYVNVSEQRGRFVKSIAVHFSPRPVNDVNALKDGDYNALWQQCGTLALPRGASRATLQFPEGVVAANLKFEYVDFYEKITGPRSSTGAMVLHCPRCTRVVNNALGGVCGHCGEVAFQCRKCRHINYDRLDAFLCVECGYCSSGSFSYEVEAGEAVSAVAILDERDLERTVASLHSRNRKYSEVKALLKKQISNETDLSGTKRALNQFDITDRINCYSAPLKRALLGEFPKITVNKSGSDKKKESKRSEPPSRASASTRARSLLSLARQLRGDSESDVRASLGDLLAQQARLTSGSGNNFPFDDGEDDMIIRSPGEGNVHSFEIQDPLSRLVANIQARARGEIDSSARRDEGEAKRGGGDNDGGDANNAKALDLAKKCYKQLKGIEKDCSEISKRIIAWKRLNQDALADYGAIMSGINYAPVHCSKCAPAVTHKFLELVYALLLCNMESAEMVLSGEFIRCLFDDQMTDDPEFVELKRVVLVNISKNSMVGSGMILEELKLRLNGGKDPISAEILGRLIGEDSVKSHASYLDLAVKTLGG